MSSPLLQREQYAKGGIGRWYWDYRDRQVFSHIRDEKAILDLGCGEGITLEKLLREFPDGKVMGIDYSAEKVRICKQRNLPACVGNAYNLGFSDSSVDCCLFLEVVEHLVDPLKALSEIHRVLREGGLLLLIFPHDIVFRFARLGFLKFREAFAPSGHVRQWTLQDMHKIVTNVGFEIEETKCLPLPCWWLSLHCLLVARKRERKSFLLNSGR
jgi:ubiquinone/menaquinone biosynthesis C-methylase UbiE